MYSFRYPSGLISACMLAALAAGSVEIVAPSFLFGAEQDERAEGAEIELRTKLNFFMADWGKVAREVAEDFDLVVVADKVPRGRFSRRDNTDYTREEALRLLNEEVEQLGFRFLIKGNYLVLLERSAERARYLPAEYGQPRQPGEASPVAAKPGKSGSGVVQVGHVEDATESPRTEGQSGPATTLMLPQQRPARDLARDMFRIFRKHSEILPEGVGGMPAFRVTVSRTKGDTRGTADADEATIAIDSEHNRLIVTAGGETSESLITLAQFLDAGADELPRRKAVATDSRTTEAVKSLAAERRRLANTFAQVEPAAEPGQEPAAPVDTPPGDVKKAIVPAGQGELAGLNAALKGEVRISSLDDLGVIIVEGNEDDVAAVVRVIQQLEQLSEVTAPEIHVRLLQEIDAVSMSQLLTSIYTKLTQFPGRGTASRQSVSIVPLDSPNAIIIVAPTGDLQSILELVDQLDRPTDPSAEVQVVRLKNAAASQAAEVVTQFFAERGDFGAAIKVLADIRTNSLILRARPREMSQINELLRRIDVNKSGSVNQMRIFPLKHAIADELAEVINATIASLMAPQDTGTGNLGQTAAGQGESAQALREARSTALQFLTGEAGMDRMIRSGILADIRVGADLRTNSLVVTAPKESMELMGELIASLDKPTSTVADIKVFTLANADAALMVDQLETLFAQTTGGTTDRPQGISVAGAGDASSSLVPLRFSVDTRTNSIIAIGGPDALVVVEALLLRLDSSDVRQRKNTVVRLKNSPAESIAEAINAFLESQRDLQTSDPDLTSSVERLESEIIVVPEPVSNSLLVSATPRYYDEITDLVKRLDEAPAQVIIQALFVEVELDNTDEFGVELGFQDPVFFARSVIENLQTITQTTTSVNGVQTTSQQIISQEGTPGFLFNNQPLGNNTAINPSSVGSQGLSNFSLGRVNNELGFGGLVLSAGSESVNVLIRALAAQRKIHILSRPQVRTLDNQLAEIQVGQQVPIVDGVNVTATGVTNPLIRQDSAGIILTVTPRISPDGQIVMEVIAEKSAFNGGGVPIFTDAATGNVIESPIKDITNARTTVSVPNGQTVVIGGMITSTDDTLKRGVPYLSDIPLLGHLFRYDSVSKRRTELIMFLTPRVIGNDIDSEIIKDVEMGRLHFMQQEAEEIHGPLYGVPPEAAGGMSPVLTPPLMIQPRPLDESELPQPPSPTVPMVPPATNERSDAGDLEDGVPTSRMQRPSAFRNAADITTEKRPRVLPAGQAKVSSAVDVPIVQPTAARRPARDQLPISESTPPNAIKSDAGEGSGRAVLQPVPLEDLLPEIVFPDDGTAN